MLCLPFFCDVRDGPPPGALLSPTAQIRRWRLGHMKPLEPSSHVCSLLSLLRAQDMWGPLHDGSLSISGGQGLHPDAVPCPVLPRPGPSDGRCPAVCDGSSSHPGKPAVSSFSTLRCQGPRVAKECPSRGRAMAVGMEASVGGLQAAGRGERLKTRLPCSWKLPPSPRNRL